MENASKALIIAGAILLSILIISLGIMIFQQANGVVDNNSMDELKITQFNSKFTQYEGGHKTGAQVNALLNQVVQNNLAQRDDASMQVALDLQATSWSNKGTGTNPTSGVSGKIYTTTNATNGCGKALTGKSFDVSCNIDDKTGLVNCITIKDAT